ncbi:MAG: hypothetical protein AAF479_03315 [Pseudomonadota bacterium]
MNVWRFFSAILLVFTPALAVAQTEFLPEQPALLVDLAPEEAHTSKGSYVQAQLRMTLRLRGRYAYDALAVTLPEIPDAEIITLQRPRTRYLVSYAGAGHVYEAAYAIIPQRSGMLEIPPIRIAGRVKTDGGADLNFDLTSEGFRVQVDPAVEGFAGATWFVADLLEIEESWSHDPADVRMGDVIRREVHIKALGTTGDRMPALEMPRASGATLVDAGRTVQTEVTGTGTIGHLWQLWDIRIDRDTFAEIAPVRMFYWNAETHSEDVVWLPVSRIEALPADQEEIAGKIMEEIRAEYQLQRMFWIELLIVLAAPAIALVLAVLYALIPTRSDLRLSGRLRSTDDPQIALKAVWQWMADLPGHPDTAPGSAMAQELRSGIADLNAATFSNHADPVDTRTVASLCLGEARRRRLSRLKTFLLKLFGHVFGDAKGLRHP